MKLIARIIGNLIFVVAFALSVKLAWELHANEIVPLGVAGLALVMSAFGLLFARNSWIESARPEWLLGLFMWIVGACAFTLTEWGYWFSSYTERHAEYKEIKKAKTRAEGLKDQAWTALTTGQVPKTSAQIQAELNAKKLDPIYSRSIQCTDATLPDSRAFCADLFALTSEYASVKKRESLEQQVQASEGPAEKTLIHDVFAQAEWLSKLLGVSEQTAATIIILGSWLVLMVCRDTGILIANPPTRPSSAVAREPLSAPEADSAPIVASEPPKPLTTPAGPSGGTKKTGNALGDMVKREMALSAPLQKPEKPTLTVVRDKLVKPEDIARAWSREFAPPGTGRRIVSAVSARWHHQQWCSMANVKKLGPQQLGQALKKVGVGIDRSSGKGSTYIFNPMEQEVEKIAVYG